MSASQVDPHDKMRARDVNKVARGEQAPRPAHEYGTVSQAPITKSENEDQKDDHHDNNKDQGKKAPECEKFALYCRSLCPDEWTEKWNKERELGTFTGPV